MCSIRHLKPEGGILTRWIKFLQAVSGTALVIGFFSLHSLETGTEGRHRTGGRRALRL